MMIKLQDAIARHHLKITGIIHVGAHWGEEHDDYLACGIKKVIYIEPCKPAYQKLRERFKNDADVLTMNVACGEEWKKETMFVEKVNNGQSNSLLKPAKHLEQFPTIVFDEQEQVEIYMLDDLMRFPEKQVSGFEKSNYNFLNMDVQGYEDRVLKGAVETLRHIHYVYTEVNTDEIYEGCARIEQLDELLSDFERVETKMGGGNWGDALYIRKTKKQPVAFA